MTTACSTQDNSCRVSCQDPSSSSQCIQLQTALIDGSSCGLGGTCQSGSCVAGSLLDTAKVRELSRGFDPIVTDAALLPK